MGGAIFNQGRRRSSAARCRNARRGGSATNAGAGAGGGGIGTDSPSVCVPAAGSAWGGLPGR